jgi:hypothetical protein
MNKNFHIIYTILCDDVRKEDNGKEFLIGILNDTIVINSVPAVLATFGIRFLVKANKTEANIQGHITGPDGSQLVRFGGQVVFANIRWKSSFFFKVSPMPIPQLGDYDIYLGMDGEPEKVHTFSVITTEQLNAA